LDQEKLQVLFCYLSPSVNHQKLKEIFTVLDPENKKGVIIGDMNARIGTFDPSLAYERKTKDLVINRRGKLLIELLTENTKYKILNGLAKSDPDGKYTFLNKNGCSVIDLCLVSNNIEDKLDLEVLSSTGSSHFPLLLRYKSAVITYNITRVLKVTWDETKQNDFQAFVEEPLHKLTEEGNGSIDAASNIILKALEHSGMTRIRKLGKEIQTFGPRWYDDKCINYKQCMKRTLRTLRKVKNEDCEEEAKLNYLRAKLSYDNLVKAKKHRFTSILHTKLSNSRNTKEFYEALSYFRPRRKGDNQNYLISPEDFASYFSDLFDAKSQELYSHLPWSLANAEQDQMNKDFSFFELNQVIDKLSLRKAAGSDGIPNEAWKSLSDFQKYNMLKHINSAWNTCEYPEEWTKIIMTPVFKKGDNHCSANYRPISLVNTGMKLFTSLLTRRIQN